MDFEKSNMKSKLYDKESQEENVPVGVNQMADLFGEKATEIVRGVARKYGNPQLGIEACDLEQELWLKILEEVDKSGGQVMNARLTARTSYNKAVDVYRRERRRWDSKADMVSDENVSKWAMEICTRKNPMMAVHPFRQPEKFLEIKDMVEEFEVGSRERKFIVMKGYIEGVFELGEAVELEPSIDKERLIGMESSEHRMAKELGLSGSGSGSYRKLKRNVRKIVRTYFGDDD
ncbi:sigma-70 family RNA polymerase sigma factor [Bacillus phage SP-15]|uniref:Sigma-70 family RNA polymerase sigma factor n=1 Tax=Bacillus phage SP-15 TaxID=1792032 RepID=A0A127AWB7_9CAUD|nr:sigma-70 family RNA polymerase sigma factor [Bacillus phage SP-15]AMM44877.1 sigma-70 family RNA polymerase sigma factor [Bacillus phage SP-15]